MRRLAADDDRDFVAVDAGVRVHRRAGATCGGKDGIGAGDACLCPSRGCCARSVLCGCLCDVACVRVGDRLGGEGDREQDEAEREQTLDQGLPPLFSESARKPPHRGYPPLMKLAML